MPYFWIFNQIQIERYIAAGNHTEKYNRSFEEITKNSLFKRPIALARNLNAFLRFLFSSYCLHTCTQIILIVLRWENNQFFQVVIYFEHVCNHTSYFYFFANNGKKIKIQCQFSIIIPKIQNKASLSQTKGKVISFEFALQLLACNRLKE